MYTLKYGNRTDVVCRPLSNTPDKKLKIGHLRREKLTLAYTVESTSSK